MPSTLHTFSNTIHIRDFILDVVPDGTRAQSTNSNYVEIHADVNVFPEDDFYDSTITVQPIHTCIRAYLTSPTRELYVPNAFFYADGRFSTAITTENKLQITVQALSLERCDYSTVIQNPQKIYHLTIPPQTSWQRFQR